MQKYSKERYSENIYAIKNEDCEPTFLRSLGVFIAHESCPFVKNEGLNVILL
jgi:hypothetical protein